MIKIPTENIGLIITIITMIFYLGLHLFIDFRSLPFQKLIESENDKYRNKVAYHFILSALNLYLFISIAIYVTISNNFKNIIALVVFLLIFVVVYIVMRMVVRKEYNNVIKFYKTDLGVNYKSDCKKLTFLSLFSNLLVQIIVSLSGVIWKVIDPSITSLSNVIEITEKSINIHPLLFAGIILVVSLNIVNKIDYDELRTLGNKDLVDITTKNEFKNVKLLKITNEFYFVSDENHYIAISKSGGYSIIKTKPNKQKTESGSINNLPSFLNEYSKTKRQIKKY